MKWQAKNQNIQCILKINQTITKNIAENFAVVEKESDS